MKNDPINPFKEIEPDDKLPNGLEEKVMASIDISQMLISISELFTDNMGKTIIGLFKTSSGTGKKSD